MTELKEEASLTAKIWVVFSNELLVCFLAKSRSRTSWTVVIEFVVHVQSTS